MLENIQGMKWFLQPNIFLEDAGEQKIYSPAAGGCLFLLPFQETYMLGNCNALSLKRGFTLVRGKRESRKEEI